MQDDGQCNLGAFNADLLQYAGFFTAARSFSASDTAGLPEDYDAVSGTLTLAP